MRQKEGRQQRLAEEREAFKRRKRNRNIKRWGVLLAIFAVAVFLFWFFNRGDSDESVVVDSPETATDPSGTTIPETDPSDPATDSTDPETSPSTPTTEQEDIMPPDYTPFTDSDYGTTPPRRRFGSSAGL